MSEKVKLGVYIDAELARRLRRYAMKHSDRLHGAISNVVEKALKEFLDREEGK